MNGMGTHRGPACVYGPPRVFWQAPLLEPTTWLQVVTAGAFVVGAFLAVVNVAAAIALAALVFALWAAVWIARSMAPFVLVADRYRWDQIDDACDAIVSHLPRMGAFRRAEVRAAIRPARWDLARLLSDHHRLADLHHETRRSAVGLAAGDPLHDELARRGAQVAERLRPIETEIEQRLQRLRSLAAQCTAFADEEAGRRDARAAAQWARRTLAEVDAGIAATAARDTYADPAADLTERAEAVFAAYRELEAPLRSPCAGGSTVAVSGEVGRRGAAG
jgi:hypothetical protein